MKDSYSQWNNIYMCNLVPICIVYACLLQSRYIYVIIYKHCTLDGRDNIIDTDLYVYTILIVFVEYII